MFFIYANKNSWYRYLFPKWMNPISWRMIETKEKLYRWLIFGWTIKWGIK